MLEHLNDMLFLAISAPPHPNRSVVTLARFIAEGSVPLLALTVAGLWIWGDSDKRVAILTASTGVLVGLGIDQAIGFVWFQPRPFMVGIGRTLLAHAPESSFPSDHATVFWSLGLTPVATGALRWWGWLFVMAGFPVAWVRIYLGLHFPLDMAGSLGVSLTIASLARPALPTIERRILPPAESLYESLRRRTGIADLRRRLRQR